MRPLDHARAALSKVEGRIADCGLNGKSARIRRRVKSAVEVHDAGVRGDDGVAGDADLGGASHDAVLPDVHSALQGDAPAGARGEDDAALEPHAVAQDDGPAAPALQPNARRDGASPADAPAATGERQAPARDARQIQHLANPLQAHGGAFRRRVLC